MGLCLLKSEGCAELPCLSLAVGQLALPLRGKLPPLLQERCPISSHRQGRADPYGKGLGELTPTLVRGGSGPSSPD